MRPILFIEIEDIVAGLCDSLVKNYLNNVCRGKEILSPIGFQGGVAANRGIQKAIERELETHLIIPVHFDVMDAIGAAKLVERAKPYSKSEARESCLPQAGIKNTWNPKSKIS